MPEQMDSDLTFVVEATEAGPALVGSFTVGGNEYMTVERIPEWIVLSLNYAVRRVRDEVKAKKAKADNR